MYFSLHRLDSKTIFGSCWVWISCLCLIVWFANIDEPENANYNISQHIENIITIDKGAPRDYGIISGMRDRPNLENSSSVRIVRRSDRTRRLFLPGTHDHPHYHPKPSTTMAPGHSLPSVHPCQNFAFPPPPPANPKRIGPRREFSLSNFLVLVVLFGIH